MQHLLRCSLLTSVAAAAVVGGMPTAMLAACGGERNGTNPSLTSLLFNDLVQQVAAVPLGHCEK